MSEVLAVGPCGLVGCSLRFAVSRFVLRFHPRFPAAALVSNVTAGFLTEREKEGAGLRPGQNCF